MNAICRSFPQATLDLLAGSATSGPNRLCTTLFCISSGLKKLSQTTPLPDNRCAPHHPTTHTHGPSYHHTRIRACGW